MNLKILIIAILAVGIVLAGGWWVWNFYTTKENFYSTKEECIADSDCPEGYWCWVGICSPPSPGGLSDCEKNLCIKECESDTDCGNEKVCKLVLLFQGGDVAMGTRKGCVEPGFPYIEEIPVEVTITTDKTEYEQGEEIKIKIINNSNKIVCFESCNTYYFQKKNGSWKEHLFKMCEISFIIECINYLESKEFEREFSEVDFPKGIYRIIVPFYTGCNNGEWLCEENEKIYSNEFTIK